MSEILIKNKEKFLSLVHDTKFRFDKKFERYMMRDQEYKVLKEYLNAAYSYVYSYLEDLAKSDYSYNPKLNLFKQFIKECDYPLSNSELEIFNRLINSQMVDEELTLYRGTSKMHFSTTHLINNNPNLTFNNLCPNDSVKPLSSLSTTLDPFVAVDFCCGGQYEYLLIEYNIDKDTPAFWASPYSCFHEKEFILPPGIDFVVDDIKHINLSFGDLHTKQNDVVNYIKMHTRKGIICQE